jgi:hypothetical protein
MCRATGGGGEGGGGGEEAVGAEKNQVSVKQNPGMPRLLVWSLYINNRPVTAHNNLDVQDAVRYQKYVMWGVALKSPEAYWKVF